MTVLSLKSVVYLSLVGIFHTDIDCYESRIRSSVLEYSPLIAVAPKSQNQNTSEMLRAAFCMGRA